MQGPANQTGGDAAAHQGGAAKTAHPGQRRRLLRGVPAGTDHWPPSRRIDGAPVGRSEFQDRRTED